MRESSPPLVVISILNWHGWRDTLECLESVRKLDYPRYLIVVIDNGSQNDSVARIRAWAGENLGSGSAFIEYSEDAALHGGKPESEAALERASSADRLVLICNKENRGFSGGHNVAIRYALVRKTAAGGVFILNNDSLIRPDCLAHVVSVQQASGAGIVGAVVAQQGDLSNRLEGPYTFRAGFFAPFVRQKPESVDPQKSYRDSEFVIATAMLMTRHLLCAIWESRGEYLPSGLFFSGEEQAFCFAARRLNYAVVMAKDAVVEHKGGRSAGGAGSTLMYYYTQRNSVLVARMIFPFHLRMLYYWMNLSFALGRMGKNLLRRRPQAAWALLHGVVDGYTGRDGKWKYHDSEAAGHQ